MFFKPIIYITFALAILFYAAGYYLSTFFKTPLLKTAAAALILLLCAPAFFLIFYFPFIDELAYLEFRAIDNIEVWASLWGLLFGFIVIKKPFEKRPVWTLFKTVYFAMLFFFILNPLYNMVISPFALRNAVFKDEWKNGVCLQSLPVTCSPSAVATILREFGVARTERELAYELDTSVYGSETWKIVRYLRKSGFAADCYRLKKLSNEAALAVISVKFAGICHSMVFFGMAGDKFDIGDPLFGRLLMDEAAFNKRYLFDGIVCRVKRAGPE